jgi:predicted Zn-dependent protease
MSYKSPTLYFFVLIVASYPLSVAQAQEKESVILRAMQDEMKRSMTELKYEGHDAPFFISYGITDATNYNAYSALGALVQSGEYKNRDKSVRVMVGNYEFNDESLDNNSYSEPTANEIPIPVDDDYFGIRRSLWTTTDIVYKGAAQQYKKHQVALKEKEKNIGDLPHREFAKVPVLKKIEPGKPYILDKSKWDNYCNQLSAVFKSYPDLKSTKVTMNVSFGTQYFITSEGTIVITPFTKAMIHCRAEAKTKKGEHTSDNIVYYANIPEEFPAIDKMKAEAKALAERLTAVHEESALEEDYSGPVLFTGAASAQVFASIFLSSRESLEATDRIPSITDTRPDPVTSLETRIGKLIVDNGISVIAKSTLKTFNGKSLISAFDVDDEGVVPPDQFILIEKGILKNLLNDRSLARPAQTANGHANGPGVLEVVSDKGIPMPALKQALIEAARKEGLDFGIMIKEESETGESIPQFFKVYVTNGKEERIRPVRTNSIALKNLKRVSGIAKQQHAYTLESGNGRLLSIIAPEALLLDGIELSPVQMPLQEPEVTYIESPLKIN